MFTHYSSRRLMPSGLKTILGALVALLSATVSARAGDADLAIPDLNDGTFTSLGGISAW